MRVEEKEKGSMEGKSIDFVVGGNKYAHLISGHMKNCFARKWKGGFNLRTGSVQIEKV